MLASISYTPIPLVELGPLSLSLHGVFAGVGVVGGGWWMLREARMRGFNADKVASIFTWGVAVALLGTRAFTIPAHIGDPGYGFSEMISITGDYSILGGYAGGIIGAVIRLRMLKMSGKAILDLVAAGMALGAVLGRIGDLAIVEHLGSRTDFFLGFAVKPGHELAPQHTALQCDELSAIEGICGVYHHTALYDMFGAAVLFLLLAYLGKAWTKRRYGQLFVLWMALYGFQRFVIDFTRLDAAKEGILADSVMGPFTGSQWGALGLGLAGLALFLWFGKTSKIVTPENDEEFGAHLGAAATP